jgi:predicted TIM-barrel fold metal-dependent hydrolase
VLEAMSGGEVLLFASDYPHWDFDDPTTIQLPETWEGDVFDGNARDLYRLPAAAGTASAGEG